MGFKHCCFLSYRHGDKTMSSFANQIVDALADELSMLLDNYPALPIFKDDRSIEVSDKVDATIAEAICRSVCMVLIYTPNYLSEEKPYCASELEAVLRLEKERVTKLPGTAPKTGMLITVILRGDRDELPQLLKDRENEDFSAFALHTTEIRRNRKFSPQIQQIAKKIKAHCGLFDKTQDWCGGCQDFKMLDTKTEKDKLTKFISQVKSTGIYEPDFDRS